ncbi:hypothetical protein [Variovorax paradoxus]|nr:hypothetical protein [Variovorax paradoxus]
MKMKKPGSFLSKGWVLQLAAISALTLLCGAPKADITGAQAQAMAENSAEQVAKLLVGVLGACANTHPDTRTDVIKAMQSLATAGLEEAEASRIIGAVGQCMSNEGAPTKSQCRELATQLPNTSFNLNDERFAPVLMAGLQMLEPCRRRK